MKHIFDQHLFKIFRLAATAVFVLAILLTSGTVYKLAKYSTLDTVSAVASVVCWLVFFALIFHILFITVRPGEINEKDESLNATVRMFITLLDGIGMKDFKGRQLILNDFINIIYGQPETHTVFLQSLSVPVRHQISNLCDIHITQLESFAAAKLSQKMPTLTNVGFDSEEYRNIIKRRDTYKNIRQIVMGNWEKVL